MAESILRDKTKEYARRIVYLCRHMRAEKKESVLINQLLRAATSIGANVHEAQYEHGRKDFIVILEIALKECYETEYWLELLYETECMNETDFRKILHDCGEIRRMLVASLSTAKSK